MRLMSYNVQTGTPTPTRAAQMLNNILTFDADIVGTQEVNARWLCIFKGTGILDKYEYVGNPRGMEDDVSNGNEYSVILFKKDMFRLIDSGTLWLSDTPHEISRIPGCAYTRIMTYALLERKSDGKRLLHVNSHLDYEFPANTEHNKILLKLTKSLGYEFPPFTPEISTCHPTARATRSCKKRAEQPMPKSSQSRCAKTPPAGISSLISASFPMEISR